MMNTLLSLADKYTYSIDLSIDPKFGVSRKVLVKFYGKFGFVQNKQFKSQFERLPVNKIGNK